MYLVRMQGSLTQETMHCLEIWENILYLWGKKGITTELQIQSCFWENETKDITLVVRPYQEIFKKSFSVVLLWEIADHFVKLKICYSP